MATEKSLSAPIGSSAWAAIGTALNGDREVTDSDVSWAINNLGTFVVEGGEDGVTLYRLYHQELVAHYRSGADEPELQANIVRRLMVGLRAQDWSDCDWYVRNWLGTHSEKAGQLGDLLRNPEFLAAASPTRLLPCLDDAHLDEERRIANVYRRASARLMSQDFATRSAMIEMAAISEDPEIAPLLRPNTSTPWNCRWSRNRPSTTHRLLGQHDWFISALAVAVVDGRPIVFGTSPHSGIDRWDLETGAALGVLAYASLESYCRAIVVGNIMGALGCVTAGDDGEIRVHDARTGVFLGDLTRLSSCFSGGITDLLFDRHTGHLFAADGNTVAVWDPAAATLVRKGRLRGRVAKLFEWGSRVVAATSDGETFQMVNGRTGRKIGPAMLPMVPPTSGATLTRVHQSARGPLRSVLDLSSAVGLTSRATDIAVAGYRNGAIHAWDAKSGQMLWQAFHKRDEGVDVLEAVDTGDQVLLLAIYREGTVRLFEPHKGEIVTEGQGNVSDLTATAVWRDGMRTRVVVGCDDGSVRVWEDIATNTHSRLDARHKVDLRSVAISRGAS